MTLYTGVEFTGDPDELVWASAASVYDAIPDDKPDWKRRYENIVGHSQQPALLTKGQIFAFALNAYAQKFLPQTFYQLETFYSASHWFLIESDLRLKEGTIEDDIRAFWEVEASGHWFQTQETTSDPCIDHFALYRDKNIYFGRAPYVEQAPPVLVPCFPDRIHYLIYERGPNGPWAGGWRFNARFPDGTSGFFVSPGGITVDATTLEVNEGGLIFVSLPDLPFGVPEPPPLIGYVTDYGPPGPPGLQGVPGPPGANGVPLSGDSLVDAVCSLSSTQKESLADCVVPYGPVPNIFAVVLASTPVEIKEAQTVLVETTPELVIPETVVVVEDVPEAFMTAERIAGTLGWRLTLVLPLALLAIKLLTESIQVFECDPDGRFGHKVLNTPMLSLSGESQKNLWQTLFNQVGWLLRCCPPCDLDTWTFLRRATGDSHVYDLEPFTAIRLELAEPTSPEINSWYKELDIHKLGEVRFVLEDHIKLHTEGYKARHTELMYWNSVIQVFRHDGADIFGFTIDMEHAKEYDIFVQYVLPDIVP